MFTLSMFIPSSGNTTIYATKGIKFKGNNDYFFLHTPACVRALMSTTRVKGIGTVIQELPLLLKLLARQTTFKRGGAGMSN